MLDWDDLRSFLAVARTGTLSAAARDLGVRQSTMGRRLAALEARAGVRLLERTPRGFVVTEAGEAARAEAERMEAAALAAERAIAGRDIRLEGFAETLLIPALADLAQRFPGIVVELAADDRTFSLAAREADIALRLARPRGQSLVGRKLGVVRFGIYASQAYLDRHGMPIFGTETGGEGHRLILMRDAAGTYPEIDHLEAIAPRAAVALRADSRPAHRAAAAAGMGIACFARHVAGRSAWPDGSRGELVRLEAPPAPEREIWLVQHEDTRLVPRIRAVADAIAAYLPRDLARLEAASG
jgi:DNA-binding transcriptional LysR family regulator